MPRCLAILLCLLVLLPACKSKKAGKPSSDLTAPFAANVEMGSYYRLKSAMNAFYDERPDSLIAKTPQHYLRRGHVVQLLDPNAGSGWARVKSEKGEIGYVKFANIKIVPYDQQPKPPKRKKDIWEM